MNSSTQVILALYLLTSLYSAGHALIDKRDSRAALIWIIVCLILPFIGPIGYYFFGINRIARIAKKLSLTIAEKDKLKGDNLRLTDYTSEIAQKYHEFIHISNSIEGRELLSGNDVVLLRHGEGAYPVMLEAMSQAKNLIVLSTYIFDNDDTGNQFAEALADAKGRGVDVYVLIDGFGALYSFPSIIHKLIKSGVKCEKFLPLKLIPPSLSINLRNHRKILVIDQCIGFTGGINISDRHLKMKGQARKVSDMHFKLQGPIVDQLLDLFWTDWMMMTGEIPIYKQTKRINSPTANMPCRVIADGPDKDLNKLGLIIHSAICTAKLTVTIMTPYFIPSREMIAILLAASNRGIIINIILPEKSNLPYVDAASRNMLWELLEWNINVYYQPAPFEHGKMIIIDSCYVLIGSANIDPRSLRLNFELMVEILDEKFAQEMNSELQIIIERSRQVSFEEVESRSLLARIKDSLAWLFSPYL